MKLVVKRGKKAPLLTNRWIIYTAVILVFTSVAIYFALSQEAALQQKTQLQTLNQECAVYGRQLTGYAALNSTACTILKNNSLSNGSAEVTCGSAFYCSYSYNCVQAGPTNISGISCLCDVLKSSQVVLPGLCIKQTLS